MYHKMNSVVNYTSSLTSEPFLYEETRLITKLRLEGYSDNEIKDKVIKENILDCKTRNKLRKLSQLLLDG